MTRTLMVLMVLSVLAGCTVPVSTSMRPDAYYEQARADTSLESLFSGDAAVLADVSGEIAAFLAGS